MLHVSSQKAQKILGIIRKDTGNKIKLVTLPLCKTSVQSKMCVLHGFGCPHSFFFLGLFTAALAAHRGSQARGPIGAVAASPCQSHARSEPSFRPTPQLMAMTDPQPTEQGQGLNPHPHG